MATKKPLLTGNQDLDDFGSGFDDFDMGGGSGGERDAKGATLRGVTDGFKAHITDKSSLRAYVGKALPRQFGELFDDYNQVSDSVTDTINSVREKTNGPINQLAKALQRKTPKRFARIHSLLDKTVEATHEYKFREEDPRKVQERMIAEQMRAVFGEFEEGRAEQAEEEAKQSALDQARAEHNARKGLDLTARMVRSSEYMMNFTRGVKLPYVKKSLELQYRMAMGITDTVGLLRGLAKQQHEQLNRLIVNTALPEVQKMHLNENFKKNIRNKFIDGALGQFGGENNPLKQMLDNFSKNVRETIEMGMMGVEMATDAMQDDGDDSPAAEVKRRRAEQLARIGFGEILPNAAGGISRKMMRKTPRLAKGIFGIARKVGRWRNNMNSNLRKFATDAEGGILNDMVAMMMSGPDVKGKVNSQSGANLVNPTHYDFAARRSIVEVIPGFLAKILQELQITRTGDESIKPLTYDFGKNRFTTQATALASLRKRTHIESAASHNLNEIIEDIERTGAKLTPEQKNDLKRALLQGRKRGKIMDERTLSRDSFYSKIVGDTNSKEIAAAMRGYLNTNERGRSTNAKKTLRASDRLFERLASTDGESDNVRAMVQEMIDNGQSELAYAAGWLQEDGNIDIDRVINIMAGADKGASYTGENTVPSGQRKGTRMRSSVPVSYVGAPPNISGEAGHARADQIKKMEAAIKTVNLLESLTKVNQGANGRLDSIIKLLQEQSILMVAQARPVAAAATEAPTTSSARSFSMPEFSMPDLSGIGESASAAAEGTKSAFSSWYDRIRGKTEKAEETPAEHGFWERNIGEHFRATAGGLSRMGRRLGRGALRVNRVARNAIMGKDYGWLSGAADKFSRSRLLSGARYFKDFKDGLPEVGDIYVEGQRDALITAGQLSSGTLRDATGRVISSLTDLADAIGDIRDEAGNVLASRKDLLGSFVRADTKVFREVWTDRLKRGFKAAKTGVGETIRGLFNVKRIAGEQISKGISAIHTAIAPPKDVYVVGRKKPILFAYKMAAGHYFCAEDGTPIERPTQIKGPVLDREGNQILTDEHFQRGLVDVNGQPFKSIKRRLFTHIANNARKTREAAGKALAAVGKGARKAGRLVGTFLSRGMTGVMSGSWKHESATGGAAGSSDTQTVLLMEIRDVLYATLLPRGNGRMFGRFGAPSSAHPSEGINTNAEGIRDMDPDREESRSGTSGNTLGMMLGGVGKGVSSLLQFGKRRWNKFRGRGEGSADPMSDSGDESADKGDLDEQTRKIEKSIERNKRRERRRSGEKTVDTSGMRKGSAEERAANWKNINAPSRTLADVEGPAKIERKNTFDLITGAIAAGFGKVRDVFSGSGDLDDLIPDGEDRNRKKGKGKAKTPKPKAPGKPGVGNRARIAGKTIEYAARGARFAGRRVLMPVLGGIAAVLGAPFVATGLSIAGAAWGMYEVYNLLKPKGKIDKTKAIFANIRHAEYGFPLTEIGLTEKLRRLEELLTPSISESNGRLELDKSKIDAEPIVGLFNLNVDDGDSMRNFFAWFNNRFKPTFLKWSVPARALNMKLTELDSMANEERLKVLEVTAENTGWDEMVNPLGRAPLAIDSKVVLELRKAAAAIFEDGKKGVGPAKDHKSATKAEYVQNSLDSIRTQTTHGAAAGKAHLDRVTPEMMARGSVSTDMAKFTTAGIRRTHKGEMTFLQSLRVKLYGFNKPSMGVLTAVISVEEAVKDYIVVDPNGVGMFQGNLEAIYKDCCRYFGMSPSDSKQALRFKTWFEKRFLPVYTTFVAEMKHRAGTTDELLLETRSDALTVYMIAQALASQSVWGHPIPYTAMPANDDPNTITEIVTALRNQAEDQTAKEPKVKNSELGKQLQNTLKTPTAYKPEAPPKGLELADLHKSAPNVMPDVEKEPPNGGGQALSKASTPNTGSLVTAGGDIASGSDGMRYIRAKSQHAISGLNPEMRRLFLAMAQEYGELTQQTIQVNRGYVTREEQAAEHAANPRKAAPPGRSLHEVGLAVDVNTVDLNRLEKLGLLRKYGFTRPVGGETWHLEPAGIQHSISSFRNDPAAAAEAIKAGVGQGGGGVGSTKTGYRFGGRDTKHAIAVRNAQAKEAGFVGSVHNVAAGAITPPSVGGGSSSGSSGASSKGSTARVASASTTTAAVAAGGGGAYNALPNARNPEEAKRLVTEAAKIVGVDPAIAMVTTAMESSFKPDAVSGNAQGLKGFMPGTWSDMMKANAKQYGIPEGTSRMDARANALLGNKYLKDNLDKAAARGLPVNLETAYLMHFLGPAGGPKAMGLPDDADMVKAFPAAASQNKATFFNKDGSPRTKGQFMQAIRDRMQKTASDFGIKLPQNAFSVGSPQSSSSSETPKTAADASATRFKAPTRPSNTQAVHSDTPFGFTPPAPAAATAATQGNSESMKELVTLYREASGFSKSQLTALEAILDVAKEIRDNLNGSKQEKPVELSHPNQATTLDRSRHARTITPPAFRTS